MPGQLAADFQAESVLEHYQNPKNKMLTFKKYRPRGEFFNTIINIGLALLLSRFMVPGDIYPAGIALGLATTSRQNRLWQKLLVLAGIFLGTWSVQGLVLAGGLCGPLFIMFVFNEIWYHQKRTSLRRLWVFFIWVILRLAFVKILDATMYTFFMTGIELVLSCILTIFFQISFKYLDNPLKAFSKLTLPALAIMIVLALGGTKGLVFQSINLAEIFAALLLIVVSYIGGGGVGATMGISIAMVLGVNTGNLTNLIATYCIVGFLGGFLKDLRKWGTILGTCLGLYFVMQQLQVSTILTAHTLPWGIGMASFVLIPRRYLSQVSNYFPNQAQHSGSMEEQKQLREILNNRLNDLAGIFEELAKSFNDLNQRPSSTQKMDLYSLLDQVCTKNCQHCNGYESCWGENFYSTYREIFDLVAFAELYGEVGSKHLKGRLAKNCFQQFKLLTTINQLFEGCQADLRSATRTNWMRVKFF